MVDDGGVTMEKATGVIRIEHLEDFAQVFQETYNTGDLDGLISLFEPEAVLVPGPSQVATGTDAIREALAGFLAAWGRFEIKVLSRHQVGDIGLQTAEWKVENNDPDGSPRTFSARPVHVFRRQADGSWDLL
ncbi:MAG: YybH family protein [Pseudonocardiaceae bacterium]